MKNSFISLLVASTLGTICGSIVMNHINNKHSKDDNGEKQEDQPYYVWEFTVYKAWETSDPSGTMKLAKLGFPVAYGEFTLRYESCDIPRSKLSCDILSAIPDICFRNKDIKFVYNDKCPAIEFSVSKKDISVEPSLNSIMDDSDGLYFEVDDIGYDVQNEYSYIRLSEE